MFASESSNGVRHETILCCEEPILVSGNVGYASAFLASIRLGSKTWLSDICAKGTKLGEGENTKLGEGER
jgi:hypothetical protein